TAAAMRAEPGVNFLLPGRLDFRNFGRLRRSAQGAPRFPKEDTRRICRANAHFSFNFGEGERRRRIPLKHNHTYPHPDYECRRERRDFECQSSGASRDGGFAILSLPVAMKSRFFLCITLLALCHPQLWPQAVTEQFPPAAESGLQEGGGARNSSQSRQVSIPVAQVVVPPAEGIPVKIEADAQSYAKTKNGVVYTLAGHVRIEYRDYVIQADRAVYNQTTSDVSAEGHLRLDGGPDDAHLMASRGKMNLDNHTGRLEDVAGTLVGPQLRRNEGLLTSSSPFAVSARVLVETGLNKYQVIDGTITSCALPNPDWQLAAREFFLSNDTAMAKNSVFELRGLPWPHRVPVFYLPYVTHSVTGKRESGILIPIFGDDSTKGLILGEEAYFVLGRSADLMLGTEYFSNRGFAPLGQFRYRGRGLDFATVKFHSLLDRLPGAQNQGGVDFLVDGRHDFSDEMRAAGDIEYLSSYAYRQAFEDNYALAINSEVKSQLFLARARRGLTEGVTFNRYQSFVSNATSLTGEEEIRILHVP